MQITFILAASNGAFYTGRAGDGWVSTDRAEAFTMGVHEAARKVELYNSRQALTGLTFKAVAK